MLNEEERELALRRIDADRTVKSHGAKERTTWKLIWRSLNFNVRDLFVAIFDIANDELFR